MSGTKEGAKKAVFSVRQRHGEDFYRLIGVIGGSKKVAKGFAVNRELAKLAGAKGGKKSRRNKNINN